MVPEGGKPKGGKPKAGAVIKLKARKGRYFIKCILIFRKGKAVLSQFDISVFSVVSVRPFHSIASFSCSRFSLNANSHSIKVTRDE